MTALAFAAQHSSRSADHYGAAERLLAEGEEWATVAYFYACYRAARAAFYNDVRLNSDASARAVSLRLTASSRHADFHNGHPGRGPGVNDIVRFLYPPIAAHYQLLHTRSNEVRYGDGVTAGTVADSKSLADIVIQYFHQHELD